MDALIKENWPPPFTDMEDFSLMEEGESSHAVERPEVENSHAVERPEVENSHAVEKPEVENSHAVERPEGVHGNVKWSQTSILENMLNDSKGTDETKTADQDLDDELRALGISVVDQLSLERDVEAAVDKAVTVHARKQRMQMLKKEIQDVKKHIKQGDLKIGILSERLSGMQRRVVHPRQYFTVEKEMKSKDEQVKALRSRAAYLNKRLLAAESNEAELDGFELEDGEIVVEEGDDDYEKVKAHTSKIYGDEKARLIREGQMTPFGTVMTSSSSKTISVKRPSYSQAEKRKIQAAVKKKAAKEDLISTGEITPFGSVVKTTKKVKSDVKDRETKKSADAMTDFEKYLEDQIDRQKGHGHNTKGIKRKKSSGDPNYGIQKRKKKPKEYVGNIDLDINGAEASKKTSKAGYEAKVNKTKSSKTKGKPHSKDPIKMKVLHPKKKSQQKVALGSVTSELEADQYKEAPRRILSERMTFEGGSESERSCSGDDSGSEYVPSDDDAGGENDVGNEVGEGKSNISEKVDKPKRKRKKKVKSEDEFSDEELPKQKGKRSSKEVDDGNIDDYVRRIEMWKEDRLKHKHAKILRGEDLDSEEEEEEGYEEFDGGCKIPLGIWKKLYKYQRTCVKWLWELHNQGCGGILGDEMGLGKTIQMISFLVGLSYSRLRQRHQRWKGLGPVLIVCPATVMHQWVKEFHKWWPPFRVAVLHESGGFVGKRPALIHNINKNDGILITSYTGVCSQIKILLQYHWHYIILDEGHKIRNPEAQITVALKRFQTPHRLILSGSPIQNSLKELWSLFDFVFPGKLGTLPVFLAEFAVPITHGGYANASKLEVQTAFKCASVLRDTINPYLLRRMKNDVRDHLNLPGKNEQVLFCSLSEQQRSVYREYLSGDQVKCIMGGRMKVFVGLINLRKICNHPDLYTGGPHTYDDYESRLQPELKYGWYGRSGKMHVLQSILRLWSKQRHRVLLFTQSRQMMCILEKFLIEEEHTYLKMDGTTTVSSRQPLIEKYNTNDSYFVFLLTTRVGGLGVNLTGADRVVIFDPDWNPSTDAQAKERAWRIGQLRHVTIYRLLTSGTIEEKIYHRQIFKQFLTNRVLQDPKQQRFFKTNDLHELFTLNEGDKEKTESSAIFAGTGSEIKVNVDDNAEESDDEQPQNVRKNVEFKNSEARKGHPIKDKVVAKKKESKSEKLSKSHTQEKERSNQKSKMEEKMRDLAKRISLNIAKKSTSSENEKSSRTSNAVIPDKEKISKERNVTEGSESADNGGFVEGVLEEVCSSVGNPASENGLGNPLDGMKVKIDTGNGDLSCENDQNKLIDSIKEEQCSGDEDSILESQVDVKKEISTNVENSCLESNADMKEETCSEDQDSHLESNVDVKEEICDTEDSCLENSVDMKDGYPGAWTKVEDYPGVEIENENNSDGGCCSLSLKEGETSEYKHRKKHKKKDKHREKEEKYRDKEKKHRSHNKGRKIDGERIDFLVKKRSYRKTAEEEAAETENAKSQDEYVLTRLFQKSGVHTALSHDSILSNNDPDYLLMEGEADRVAKEALKAVRASRARCFRPWPSTGITSEPKKSKPKFGSKKNKVFADSVDREIKKDEEGKSKKAKSRMFDGGLDDDEDDNADAASEMTFIPKKKMGNKLGGGLSSSQLLSRIHQRNKTVCSMELTNEEPDEDYDPDYPSTAAAAQEPEEEVDAEVKDNIDLLADIRNFVAFQAEVDGSASTKEILDKFRARLPPNQTPFFKALLTKICDFHRKSSGEGIWSLKDEFR